MGNIAVIDTETNWADAVMSIGRPAAIQLAAFEKHFLSAMNLQRKIAQLDLVVSSLHPNGEEIHFSLSHRVKANIIKLQNLIQMGDIRQGARNTRHRLSKDNLKLS